MRSYNANDVAHEFCANCDSFHADLRYCMFQPLMIEAKPEANGLIRYHVTGTDLRGEFRRVAALSETDALGQFVTRCTAGRGFLPNKPVAGQAWTRRVCVERTDMTGRFVNAETAGMYNWIKASGELNGVVLSLIDGTSQSAVALSQFVANTPPEHLAPFGSLYEQNLVPPGKLNLVLFLYRQALATRVDWHEVVSALTMDRLNAESFPAPAGAEDQGSTVPDSPPAPAPGP